MGLAWIRAGLACLLAVGSQAGEPRSVEAGEVGLEYEQRSWLHSHGLPAGDRVWTIRQTRDGYLWLGTQHGLARFDGLRFTLFDRGNTPELPSDDCRALEEDDAGNLWISTQRGIVRKSGRRFFAFPDEPLLRSQDHSLALCPSRRGGVWVGLPEAICLVQRDRVATVVGPETAGWGSGAVTVLQEAEDGALWMGTLTGLMRLDASGTRIDRLAGTTEVGDRPILDLWLARTGRLWILYGGTVASGPGPYPGSGIASIPSGPWPQPPVVHARWFDPDRLSRFLVGDAAETLWLSGPPGGINRFRDGQVEFVPMLHRGRGDFALDAMFDREGNLWFGTSRSGLQRWTPRRISACTRREGLPHDNVWTIAEAAAGGVWIGTDGGVARWSDGQIQTLQRPDGSSPTDVRAVAEDQQGLLWVGTMRSLERFQGARNHPIQLPGDWFETKVRALLPGRDGSMWVGTVRGLTRIAGDERTTFRKADGLGSDEVRALVEDRSGALWIGTLGGGVSRLQAGAFTTFTTADGLPSDNVWALHEDPDGVLWLGTDRGLARRAGGRFTSFGLREGLPDLLVNCLVSDHHGRLWIGHDRGIYALDRRQLQEIAEHQRTAAQAILYGEVDGLPSQETNGQKSYPAACRTQDGRLWFPTTQGVAILDPARLAEDQVAPLSVLEEVRANGRPVFGDGVSPGSASSASGPARRPGLDLDLPPGGARVLEFHYTANTFVAPEQARFRYRLVGLDDHWIEAGTRRQASFTDLRPGIYRFEVQACNHRGLWQPRSTGLDLRVTPFFYQTGWFVALCALGLAGATGLAIQRWNRQAQRKYEVERVLALDQQRQRIARDIHDELGASLTHILQLADRVGAPSAETSRSAPPAERIASIASEAIDQIGEIVWANNPDYDSLEDLAAYLREYAATFLADTGILAHLDFPETVPHRHVNGLFRRHLVLFLKEALRNLCRHAHARQVTVRLRWHDESIELSLVDDGRGFAVDGQRPGGHGLASMRQRVAELGGTLTIHSQPGQGTELSALVPLEPQRPSPIPPLRSTSDSRARPGPP